MIWQFPQEFIKYIVHRLLVHEHRHMDAYMHAQTAQKQHHANSVTGKKKEKKQKAQH